MAGRRLGFGGWCSLALCAASASVAHAAPSARLTYVREAGAEGCPDEEGLRRAVAARLGYDPFFPWAKVTVVAHVRRDGAAFRGEVTLVDEQGVARGKRAVEAPGESCAPLVGVLALSISLALDPLSLTPKAGEAGGKAGGSTTVDAGKAGGSTTVDAGKAGGSTTVDAGKGGGSTTVDASPPWRGWIGVAALGTYGATPGFAFGGALRFALERGPLVIGLEARADAPTSAAVPPSGEAQAWIAQGSLLGCGRVSWLVGCGLVSAGPMIARGEGLTAPRTAVVAYGAAGARIGVSVPLGDRFRFDAFTQVAFALARRALQVDGADAYRQPAAAFSVGVGASAKIF